MMKTICAIAGWMLLLAGTLAGQVWTEWKGTSNNPDIQYRSQAFEEAKACYVEFRDQQQGPGYTTFDAAADYKSTDLNTDKEAVVKTETEHIVTAPTHSGSSRISNCTAVVDMRVSFVQRH
jgi:hypothetical protein